ncbi:MAG: YbaK/EbsC family protein [Candidatus Taylorbacteria bacterium]|nr:YbaK/EbsC family protein [Candidatus Taylorbacteria bacterium]
MIKNLGKLAISPVSDSLNLVAPPTASLLKSMPNVDEEIGVTEIDQNFSDTAAFCGHYEVGLGQTVNCVVIKATRGDKNWYAACLIFGNTRADVNGLVRRHLGARKASFAPMEEAVALTKMEYGGITPVGLPADWPIIIDKAVADSPMVVIGSGIRKSKLVVTGKFLTKLPNAVVLEGVAEMKSE